MTAKHHVRRWKEQLRTFSSIFRLAGNLFRAVHYFQLSCRELSILGRVDELAVFFLSFF